ncbi:MAG TPA: hypothetical protein PKD85_21280, partial [Saprospiraceae bacterium]|nr:hypothetical protein [Saprospiraceae bacterium]
LSKAGPTQVSIGVKAGNKGMTETTDILVNYPNPYETQTKSYKILSGESKSFKLGPLGYPDASKSQLQISSYKIPNMLQYATELIQYPYGCLEQTTSASFGQLYLDDLIDLKPAEVKKQKENLEAGVVRILSLSDGKGRFNYWSNGYYDDWSNLYAGNFLIEYQKKVKNTSTNDIFQSWITNMTNTANNWTPASSENEYAKENATYRQAYRLFLLAKTGKPAKSAMNRLLNMVNSKESGVYYLLAATYQLSGFESKALELIKVAEQKIQYNDQNNTNYYYYNNNISIAAIIVECLSYIPSQKKNMEEVYSDLVDQVNKSWLSTYNKGYIFLATSKMYGSLKNLTSKNEYNVIINGKKESMSLSSGIIHTISTSGAEIKNIEINNIGKTDLIINQFDRFIDKNLTKEANEQNLNIELSYYNNTQGRAG